MSLLNVDKVDPSTGTALEIGTSGDTISIPSGATLDISASTLTPPATMPASSGINLTALNATNLGSGTVPTARLGTGTASSSTVLYGDSTYKTEPSGFDSSSITGQSDYGAIVPATDDSLVMYDTSAAALREVTIQALGNTPAFKVKKTSTQGSIGGGDVLITFGTVHYDSHSGWDTGTSLYTVPADCDGKYYFTATLYEYTIPWETGDMNVFFYKNGAKSAESPSQGLRKTSNSSGNEEMGWAISQSCTLVAGDTWGLYTARGGFTSTYNAYQSCRFEGFRIAGV